MIQFANRLDTVQEYYFSKKLKEVRGLIAAGKPIINMGIGSPDLLPPIAVVDAISSALSDQGAHQYQSYQGRPELRSAIANFYNEKYGVKVDEVTEILPMMGSKEAIMHISLAFLNPGDEVLIPNPGYPTYSSVTKLVQANARLYDLTEDDNWLPDLNKIEKTNLDKVKLMWINYPHMPTGAVASIDDLSKIISFAKRNNILVINDNPYSFILNEKPLSILQIQGAKNYAIELNSLSKSFNMAGWRVGMALGKEEYINAILKVKSNMDSGMFYGVQMGAVAALKLGREWFETNNEKYRRRSVLIQQLADKLGCSYNSSASGMFLWAKLPSNQISAEDYVDKLLYESDIFIAPGTIFGSNGEGYVRFSLCVSEQKIQEAISRF